MGQKIWSNLRGALKGKRWLLLLGALGLCLLLLGGGVGSTKTQSASPVADAEAYRVGLEASVKALCEAVDGVGEATVLITLSETECAVYEKNKTASGESVASSGGDALLVGYKMPSLAGVAVVCDGGGSVTVQNELTSLLSAALSLPSTRIHIAPSK
jgi:stage III sporulation protein AG